MTPTIAKLLAAGLAIAAYVATAFVKDPTAAAALQTIAGGLVGWQFAPRHGDVPVMGVNVDDIGGQS